MSERHREALAHAAVRVRGARAASSCSPARSAPARPRSAAASRADPERCNVAYIFNPSSLSRSCCAPSAPSSTSPPRTKAGAATVKDHVDALNEYLLRTHAAGQNCVLIIDEAQNLSADVLEQLRLLTNLETASASCCRSC